jgi:hypothetical protein
MEMPALLPRAKPTENALQFSYFAVYLFLHGWNTKERGNQHRTIASKVSAIIWHHRVLTGYEPEIDAGFSLVLRTLKRLSRPVAKKPPMTPDMLRSILLVYSILKPLFPILSQPAKPVQWQHSQIVRFFRHVLLLRVVMNW